MPPRNQITGTRLTPNAIRVLEKRYLGRELSGELSESPDQLFRRVASSVALAEKRDRSAWSDRYEEMMASLRFLPNTPTLINAGRTGGQLSACFVLPVEDSLDSIFETLKNAAKIHQSGGGTGFSFSRLRAQGSAVRSTNGIASGPVSFMRIFDTATETIKQGGARRGANMAVLRVDHPDIEQFITCKLDQRSILNFNISVGVTDEFMKAVQANTEFALRDPSTGKTVRKVRAAALFEKISDCAWQCGDPGLVFLDRIAFFNPTPLAGQMESTNPCGEQPLLPFESCNLGSLNLGAYFREGRFNEDLFTRDIEFATRFLDDVIDVNIYPVRESERITLRNRKIGLGVMGFADLLLKAGIRYGSDESYAWGDRLMSRLDRGAKRASMTLAEKKGAFPNWRGSLWHRLGYPKMRNSTVSTVAPTGTISILAGSSSGIEPIYAGIYHRNVLSGDRLKEVHPAVAEILSTDGVDLSEADIAKRLGQAWAPAAKVTFFEHVKMQSVFQRHSDSAVSKTVNLPFDSTRGDVSQVYRWAFELGCKGITVYRDRSRSEQVLEKEFCPTC